MRTAEWMCQHCGRTNRKLVGDSEARADDRCFACRNKHHIEEDERPVRWRSKLKK